MEAKIAQAKANLLLFPLGGSDSATTTPRSSPEELIVSTVIVKLTVRKVIDKEKRVLYISRGTQFLVSYETYWKMRRFK